jgi:prefoldin subunit 5
MREQLQARLDELKRQYQLGEGQLRELSRQEAALRETLLRITGAIQVLEELLSDPAAQNGDRGEPEVLTVP